MEDMLIMHDIIPWLKYHIRSIFRKAKNDGSVIFESKDQK